ncbi:MAG: M2 family metallopeptidase [Peptococcaceae bacterium]|nr:M2 family metallopeptidase [Peptococcaceae bacterium]
MPTLLTDFMAARIPTIARLSKAEAQAYWLATTTGDAKYEQEYARAREELLHLLSNREDFQTLAGIKGSPAAYEPLLRRQADVLYNMYLANQTDPTLISRLVQMETEVESTYTNFRAAYRGQAVTNNEIDHILRVETDNLKRQHAWEASKQIGVEVAEQVIELVKLRNRIARDLNFSNYQQMELTLSEIDPEWLFTTLAELKQLTDTPFRRLKEAEDAKLKKHFGVDQLMPWHYSDPFFQEVPATDELGLDDFLSNTNIADLAAKYYTGIGLDTASILARSDLYERPGKNQHAYCTDIDRAGDIRILCNVRNDEYWLSTLLHELGHGVYDLYHDSDLPFLLRTPAHTFTTEAIAMLMERQLANPDWLTQIAEFDPHKAAQLEEKLTYRLALGQLIFMRWGLVVVYFEQALYANPEQDLNKLWWDLVEELQLVQRPPDRLTPDWAAKIHIATAPVYYQNYILGALTASQLQTTLEKQFGSPLPVNDPGLGQYLIDRIFAPAARYPWAEMLTKATGESLSPRHFARQFIAVTK